MNVGDPGEAPTPSLTQTKQNSTQNWETETKIRGCGGWACAPEPSWRVRWGGLEAGEGRGERSFGEARSKGQRKVFARGRGAWQGRGWIERVVPAVTRPDLPEAFMLPVAWSGGCSGMQESLGARAAAANNQKSKYVGAARPLPRTRLCLKQRLDAHAWGAGRRGKATPRRAGWKLLQVLCALCPACRGCRRSRGGSVHTPRGGSGVLGRRGPPWLLLFAPGHPESRPCGWLSRSC